jgi:hypothetical protein
MWFPLRLTANLGLGLTLRSLRLHRARPLMESVAPDSHAQSRAPIVWIAGAEPLDLPETPRLVNSLAAAGRHVFLSTTGILLRRRIHDGAEVAHDGRAGRQGAFRDALESVRTAKLSGFLLCAQLILYAPSESVEIEHLHADLRKLDFDGFVISPVSPVNGPLSDNVAALRRRLLSRRWALLSSLLDPVLSTSISSAPTPAAQSASRRSREHALPASTSYEESVQTP